MSEPRPGWTRREVNWFLLALALLVIAAVLITDRLLPDPGATPAQAAYPAAAATQSAVTPELLAELAGGAECRQAAQAFAEPAERLRVSWEQHAEAHHLGMTGQISKDEMRQRWKVTLARRLILDPMFSQGWQAMSRACGQETTASGSGHGGHQP